MHYCMNWSQGEFQSSAMAVVECVYSGLDSHCYRRGVGLSVPGAPVQVFAYVHAWLQYVVT